MKNVTEVLQKLLDGETLVCHGTRIAILNDKLVVAPSNPIIIPNDYIYSLFDNPAAWEIDEYKMFMT